MALSVLARLMRQGAFEKFNTGEKGPRTNPNPPALKGFTRGTLGTLGSTVGPATRNSDAGEQRDRQTLSPIIEAYMSKRV